jgi:hypothetical protein
MRTLSRFQNRQAGLVSNELLTRNTHFIGLVALALLGAVGFYAHERASPACDSEQAMDRVSAILRNDFHLDSLLMTNVRTVSGGYFSDRHDCSAEVTQIRGNVDASGMPWRAIRYRIVHPDQSQRPAITVELGGSVPLAAKRPSLWKRLLAYL